MRATKRKRRRGAVPLPMMLTELALSSWETIAHRSWMMACGSCSSAEYQCMFWEKITAAQLSSIALLLPTSADAVSGALEPWHGRAMANARRLRRR